MLAITPLALPEVLELKPRVFEDERGSFCETFNQPRLVEHGLDLPWMQDNQSRSVAVGTLRGLHFQEPPFAQDKLVRVLRGRIVDVAVDIREGSPSFRQWVALELAADAMNQIFVPAGFAHGFVTLEPDTVVMYKVTAPYSGAHDRSIAWDDPDLGVDWGDVLAESGPVLSDKDRDAPRLRDISNPFRFEG